MELIYPVWANQFGHARRFHGAKADSIAIHMRNTHHLGITFDEIKEVILQCTIYLGMPKALFAMRKLKAVMAEEAKKSKT